MNPLWPGLIAAATIAGAFIFYRWFSAGQLHRTSAALPSKAVSEESMPSAIRQHASASSGIAIGCSADETFVTISEVPSSVKLDDAENLEIGRGSAISRLNILIQAVPSLATATKISGKHLMEVQISGPLARAADGNGLRAFSIGAGGIQEHARLFNVENLNNLVSCAAVWQIASVIVAQKHLADISRKLDEIKRGVEGISRFLDNQRKARISGIYSYLGQIHAAIQKGGLPNASRSYLEHCEGELLEIQHHLSMEFRQKLEATVSRTERFGTKQISTDLGGKVEDLDCISRDIALCLKTRVAAYRVLTLFPGETHLLEARQANIMKSIESFAALNPEAKSKLAEEIEGIDSLIWKAAAEERRNALSVESNRVLADLTQRMLETAKQLEITARPLALDEPTTRLLLEYDGSLLIGARKSAN